MNEVYLTEVMCKSVSADDRDRVIVGFQVGEGSELRYTLLPKKLGIKPGDNFYFISRGPLVSNRLLECRSRRGTYNYITGKVILNK